MSEIIQFPTFYKKVIDQLLKEKEKEKLEPLPYPNDRNVPIA